MGAWALFIEPGALDPGLLRVRLDNVPAVPNTTPRERLIRRHRAVKEAYGAFLSDIAQIIEMSLLADESVAETSAFVTHLVTCDDASRRGDLDYERAVEGLEFRWDTALNHAKEMRWSTLSAGEQKVIRRARSLLDRAMDPGATVPERRSCLRKVLRLVESVVHVPALAVAALSAGVQRLELPGGDDVRMGS